jgi:LuxR family transcriptional regulator, maltose regulon positive regulatory protein
VEILEIRRLPTPPHTKLAPPSSEALLLARPDVLAAFCGLRAKKLALVTAPSASGKSTLMSQAYLALAAQGMDVCWLSLDASDNDAQRFCTSLIAAIQRARPAAGASAFELMRTAPRVPLQEAIASLINDLTTSAAPLAIFLDDFQEITSAEVHSAVSYLLQYSAASVHLAIASQIQPPLAVARIRARGAVIELGFADLRFSAREIRDYLQRLKKLDVSETQIGMLTEQTEGWIGGLQLATIALAQRAAAASPLALEAAGRASVTSFADYLLEDILARQSAAVREFLTRTAILDQFSVPLADAVTGRRDARVRIAELERANLFILRLDEERIWYRYHHLFSAFLRQRLKAGNPALRKALYQRACYWLDANGLHADALRYALRGDLQEPATRLLENYGRTLLREGNLKELNYWLEALPRPALTRSATLCVLDAWTQLYLGDALAAIRAIRAAELAIDGARNGRRVSAGVQTLRAELQILRTMSGVTRYDLPDVGGLKPELPQAFGPEDPLQRAYAWVVLGYAARLAGRLDTARANYAEAVRISDASEDTVVNLIARYNVAIVDYLRARPDIAVGELAHWLGDARNRRWLRTGSAGFLRVALAIMRLEFNDTTAALAELDEAIELLDSTQTYAFVGVAQVIRAQVLALLEQHTAAEADLARARALGAERNLDRVIFRADLVEAHLASRAGAPERAQECLQRARSMLEVSGHAAVALHTEHHASWTSACVELEIAQGRFDSALKLATAAYGHARRAGRARMQIEFRIWQALARDRLGDAPAADKALGEALARAAPAGVVYPFLAPRNALAELLERHSGAHAAFAQRIAQTLALRSATSPAAGPRPRTQTLQHREVQILNLLGLGLRNREIGQRLFISEETVKWYLKKIYETLQVGNRTHALVRARELGLLQ